MKYIYALLISCTFFSCKEVQRNEIVGAWKSQDGCILYLKNDSTFKIIDLPESILFDSKSNNKLTSIGEWELINFGNNWRIELTFSESDIRPYLFSNGLLIERKISVTKNYWSIYFYDGNNDEKYIFNKISSIKQNESR